MAADYGKVIFFIGNMSHSGGTERVLSVIANGLSRRGFPISVISLWGDGKLFFQLEEAVSVYWVEKERKQTGITGNLRYLTMLLERVKPDFLVDVDIILGCYSIFLKRRMPEVRWVSWEHFNYYYHFEKNHFLRKMIRRLVAKYSDQLVVLTDEDKGNYEKNLKLRCRINRIYNPVPYEGCFSKKMEKPVIFAAGRLTKVKGFDLLIDSWKQLEAKYPQWSVVIAGEGKERRKLEKKAKAAGIRRLRFVGTVFDIEKYYSEAAIFAFPSRDEGFGMTLLEAMYFCLPAVSYNCKSGPKEIVADKINGFLVEMGNTKAFTQTIESLMKDKALRRKIGEQAGSIDEKFQPEIILDQWISILTNLKI